jgi:hypothetical protein
LISRTLLDSSETALIILLEQEELQDVTEIEVFKVCEHWAKARDRPRDAAVSVFSLIRFRMFTAQEFIQHVVPSKLLTDDDNIAIVCSLVTRDRKMPQGFSNEVRPRCIVGDVETVLVKKNRFIKSMLSQEISNCELFRFSINSAGYIMGVQLKLIKHVQFHYEHVQVYLRTADGLVAATEIFEDGHLHSELYNFRFEPPHVLFANVVYTFQICISNPNITYSLESCQEQILTTTSGLKISIQKLDTNPISSLSIAKKTPKIIQKTHFFAFGSNAGIKNH